MKIKHARPIIGITCSRSVDGRWSGYSLGHFAEFALDVYSQAILNCGGTPLLVPVSQNRSSLGAICSVIDGLLLSGGADITPRFYGEESQDGLKDVDEVRDLMEIELTHLALKTGMPIFGICRGQQVLNVALGGTLYQDIPRQVPASLNHAPSADRSVMTHKIKIETGTHLHKIIQRRNIWVNSKHHQSVKEAAPGLVVSATASDGIIEAIEDPQRPFVLAVQWHPEGLWHKDAFAKNLFKAFIAAADVPPH